MADRYIVKSTLPLLASWPFKSEQEALKKAAELFDEHGPQLQIEILLNDMEPPLYGTARMAKWNRERKKTSAAAQEKSSNDGDFDSPSDTSPG